MPMRTLDAAASAARSSSEPDRVFGSADTIIRSDAPIADATADADPPPGAGSDEANAASRSRTDLSVSIMRVYEGGAALTRMNASLHDNHANRVRTDTNQSDYQPIDDDG